MTRAIHMVVLVLGVAVGLAPLEAHGEGEDWNDVAVIAALLDEAEPGSVVVVPAGMYRGQLQIQKAVTLEGRGAVTIDGGGVGSVIEVFAPDVTIRGLSIRGSGSDVTGEPAGIRVLTGPVVIEDNQIEDALFGIDLRESPGSVIRRNRIRCKDMEPGRRGDAIRLWWSHECVVSDNEVRGSRDLVFWYSEGLTISRNRVRDSRYGLHFMYSHDTLLEENELTGNSVGVYLMYSNRIDLRGNRITNNRGASGYGIGLKDCDAITVEGNALLANRVGLYIDNSPSSEDSTGLISGNMFAFNEIGLLATPNTHDNIVTGNALIENEQQAATHGRGALMNNTFSRDGVGNFWSDYAGYDRDGDGIGDVAYRAQSLFESMLANEPNLRVFIYSPAQQAVEFTARALPELLPEPTLVDFSPLAMAPQIDVPRASAVRPGWPVALLGVGLAGGAGALCFGVCRSGGGLVSANKGQA